MKLNREKFGPCITAVGEKAGVDDDAAFDIIQTVAQHGERLRQGGEQNPFGMAAKKISEQEVEDASLKRADVLRNTMIRNSILDDIREKGGVGSAENVLRSLLHGTNRGDRDSIQAQWRGNSALWQGLLDSKLRAAGLDKVAVSGEMDGQVSDALFAMSNHEPVPDHVSAQARQMAEILKPITDHVKERLNAAGANIGDGTDYVGHTSRDWRKMRLAAGPNQSPEAAFDAWWKFEQPLWGERTFENVTPEPGQSMEDARTEFAKSVFDSTVSNVHKTPAGALGDEAPSYFGSPNLAKRISQSRVVFYKDGASWNASMKRFGTANSLTHNVLNTVESGARQLALMDKLGTNPGANLDLIARKVQEEYRTDLDGVHKFQTQMNGVKNVLAHLDGSANRPENEGFAALGAGLRTYESTTSLGSVGITHFASIWPTVTAEMAHHGVSRLETIGKLTGAILGGLKGDELKDVAADLGAFHDGLSHDMMSRWQADDNIPGRMSTIANVFMKYTGLPYVYNNTKAAVRFMLSANLGRRVGQALDELEPHLQNMLRKYGIDDGDWNLLRQGELTPANGNNYLTPGTASKLDAADVEGLLRSRGVLREDAAPDAVERAVQRYQWGLSDKLSSYFGDAADHAVVTPGVQERAFAYGGERPGTFGGEMRRFLWQFKMWPLAVMNQVIGREIYMATSARDAVFNIGSMLALTSAAGYGRMALNDAIVGRKQRNPLDPGNLMMSLSQGGGMGVLGDLLFGESGRQAGGLANLAGPVVGDAGKVFDVWNRFTKEASSDDPDERARALNHAWPPLMRLGIGKVPFANMAYLKGALDYLLWYHLYDAASPGWWDRTNQRMEREQGRTMLGYRPGGTVPYPTDLLTAH